MPIVRHLRTIGASVQILSFVGKGCPDLLTGYKGKNILLEVKTGKGKLTPDQVIWHSEWQGQVHTCRTAEEAEQILRKIADA